VTQPKSQCAACKHFRSAFSVTPPRETSFCSAFPDGIPDRVYANGVDHRQPVEGDHGVRWESNGDEFPEYALTA